jgi:histidinol-phosphate aminotransferase
MGKHLDRRDWLRTTALTSLGMGLPWAGWASAQTGLETSAAPLATGPAGPLVNLSSNENPYGISPAAKKAILGLLDTSHRYQYNVPSLQSFKKELTQFHGLAENQVLLSPGSGEALGLLARHFNKGKLVSAFPTFATLPTQFKKQGGTVVNVPLTPDQKHDLPAMLAAIDNNTSLVYVCNPANPSSTVLDPAALTAFCRAAAQKATVVIDEAYMEYLEGPMRVSMIPLIAESPNIIVLKTFSKIHAMAGLRVGYTLAQASTISALQDNYFTRTQYGMSVLSITAAQASLADEAHQAQSRQRNAAVRTDATTALAQLGIKAVPSFTNFIFFPLGNYAGDFAADMLKQNIFLRADQYNGQKWARVSVGTETEMKAFLEVMQKTWKAV